MVGIITINDNDNYGNRLQNYAVYSLLSKYDNVENIIRINGSEIKIRRINRFKLSAWKKIKGIGLFLLKNKKYKYLKARKNKDRLNNFLLFNNNIVSGDTKIDSDTDFSRLNEKYDIFFVGSDQVWNPNIFKNGMYINMLGFTTPDKKASLAPSIAVDSLNNEQEDEMKKYLRDFKYISCREKQGSELIKKVTGRESVTLIDPTLMIKREEWDSLCKKPVFHKDEGEYVLLYFLGEMTNEYWDIVNKIAKKWNLYIVNLLDFYSPYYTCGPSEFLYLIKNCRILLTDSFHGSVFSYIYEKPFRVFRRVDNLASMNSRLENLQNILQLGDLTVNNTTNLDDIMAFNYDKVHLVKQQEIFQNYLDEIFSNQFQRKNDTNGKNRKN